MASRNPINANDLREELEALDGHAYNLQVLRDRIDTSIGALHDQITAHDMAHVRAFVREAVALWDRISSLYESHTAAQYDAKSEPLPDLAQRTYANQLGRPFRLPNVADAPSNSSGSLVREQAS